MRTVGKIVLWVCAVSAFGFGGLLLLSLVVLGVSGDLTAGQAIVTALFGVVPMGAVGAGCVWGARRLSSSVPGAASSATPTGGAALPSAPSGASARQERAARRAAAAAERQRQREAAAAERERQRQEREARELAAAAAMEEQRRQQAELARAQAAAEAARREREGYMRGDEWVPPSPHGVLVEAWAPGRSLEVVGEAYRPAAFITLMARRPGFRTYEGVEIDTDAILVPDPHNPYGRGEAVAVFVGGEHVGFLAQEDAHEYYPSLADMRGRDELLRVPARTWASNPGGGRVNARVTLVIPEARGLRPSNDLPADPYVVIPAGRRIQVTKEDEHMDVLSKYVLRGSGVDNYVAATLRSINEIRPRSSYECVQVELDGQRVGVLTKGQSEKLLPLVRHIEERGKVPVVRATVTGTKLKADVILHTADATTIEDSWIEALGEAVTAANIDKMPVPKRPDFEWDDED